MHGLMLAGVELDRKVLADIAVRDADTFRAFVEVSREASASTATSRASPRGVGCLGQSTRQRRASRASLLKRTAPFFVLRPRTGSAINATRHTPRTHSMTKHHLHHNPHLKAAAPPAAQARARAQRRFVAEGEDLIAAAELAGWPALEGYRVAGSGLGGEGFIDVEETGAGGGVDAGFGHARDRRVRAALGAAPVGPLCVYLHGVGDPGNVGTVLRSAKAFGASGVALGPGLRRSVFAEGRAGEHGRDLRGGDRARGVDRRAARRAGGARRGPRASRCSGLAVAGRRAPGHAAVGAEREGLPEEVVAACERVARIPIAVGVAERRDGGDRGAVRDDHEVPASRAGPR